MSQMKKAIFAGSILLLLAVGSSFAIANKKTQVFKALSGIIDELMSKMKAFNAQNPEDKTYIHSDKPFYKPGETVWFAVYVRNGKDLKASTQSDIVNVEVINPKGAVEKSLKIVAKDGIAQGDFEIDANAPGGIYKLRAFTNWMKNDPEPAIFEKEIQVQAVVLPRLKMKLDFPKDAYGPGAPVSCDLTLQTNANEPLTNHPYRFVVDIDGKRLLENKGTTDEKGLASLKFDLPAALQSNDGLLNVMLDYQGQTEAISRSIPITLNQIQLSFMPEGGDMIEGLPATIGFRALNEYGKPADISGHIEDAKGMTVATFGSYHKGMGALTFVPQPNQTYTAHIEQPAGISKTYALPAALPAGFALAVEKTTRDDIFLKVHSTVEEEVTFTASVHGHNYFAGAIKLKKGANTVTLPTLDMPVGIAQVTLFDSKGIERAERLVFVNQHKKLKISLATDKEKYLPREKVNLTVSVKDERGMPMPAHLSLAVVNDQLLSFADDKSSDLLSWLLVEGELKGKVEEPDYYFDEEVAEEKRNLALNYLLMTAGWRRYTWKAIRNNTPIVISYPMEKAQISGIIYNENGQPQPNVTVSVSGQTSPVVKTDANGRYTMRGLILDKPVTLIASSPSCNQSVYVTQYGEYWNISCWNSRIETIAATKSGGGGKVKSTRPTVVAKGDIPMAMPPAPPMPVMAPMQVENELDDAKDMAFDNAVPMDEDKIAAAVAEVPQEKNAELQNQPVKALEQKMKEEVAWGDDFKVVKKPILPQPNVTYYRAKEFAAPVYTQGPKPGDASFTRNDFRATLYWNGNVAVDNSGKTTLSFYTSDEITSFRITTEGIATDGMPGRAEKVFYTQLPFSIASKLPVEVVTEDQVRIPLTLVNNTDKALTGPLKVQAPDGLQSVGLIPASITLNPKEAKTVYLKYNVNNAAQGGMFEAEFQAMGLNDKISQSLKVVPKGFPVKLSAAGSAMEESFSFTIKNSVQSSIKANVTAYPSTVGEILKGLEGMLQEPYGCFEQTSSSTYPNILVLNYLNQTGQANPQVTKRAKELIERGYQRLTSYESPNHGFEWFGGDPAHEGLTAYGLMEFLDMEKVWEGVDKTMIKRTKEWLMARRDGKGGFERNPRALHEFGLADQDAMNAYIVWALSESKMEGLEKELNSTYAVALDRERPYELGLVANAMFNYGKKKEGEKALAKLIAIQNKNGAWQHVENYHSAPGSGGQGLGIETAALALMAMMKADMPDMANIRKVAEFIRTSRNGAGAFGNTNSTVLALKSLIQYANFTKKTDEEGTIVVYVDDREAKRQVYKKGTQDAIVIDGLEKFMGEGTHTVKVQFQGVKNPLPYSVAVNYHTTLPNSQPECKVKLETQLSTTRPKVGETVRLSAKLTNLSAEGQPMTMAIIGLPAGLSAQPWQLKELKEKGMFDFYEVNGNNVILYYRQMKPSEVRNIALDLKTELAGTFEAPASVAYLYYTNEHRNWTALPKITITE